jgi:ParB family chromosome partitioning protein
MIFFGGLKDKMKGILPPELQELNMQLDLELFPEEQSDIAEATIEETIEEVNLTMIDVNPYQPRKEFSEEELMELAASIREIGLIQPPVVRPLEGGRYELIAGERRFRASKLLGLESIKVIVRRVSAPASAQAALIENVQRVDLNPLEVAYALKRLQETLCCGQDGIAKKVGKKRSTVANYLRLLSLPIEIQKGVSKGAISMGHAKVILSMPQEGKQIELMDRIVKYNLTVREAEKEIEKFGATPKKKKGVRQDVHLMALEEKFREKLGTKVTIEGNEKGGKVVVHYYSLDDLDHLIRLLKVQLW